MRILSPADEECWTILPRYVYDNADEREAHIRILAQSVARKDLQITWYTLSNVDHRLLLIRNANAMRGFKKLLGDLSHIQNTFQNLRLEATGRHTQISTDRF